MIASTVPQKVVAAVAKRRSLPSLWQSNNQHNAGKQPQSQPDHTSLHTP